MKPEDRIRELQKKIDESKTVLKIYQKDLDRLIEEGKEMGIDLSKSTRETLKELEEEIGNLSKQEVKLLSRAERKLKRIERE